MKKGNDPGTRRKFLAMGLLGGAGAITQPVQAMVGDPLGEETVKMLTPDGKLVEVPKSAITRADAPKKAANHEILDWVKPPKPNK